MGEDNENYTDMTLGQALRIADLMHEEGDPLPLDLQTRLLELGVDISIYN